jgi:membrane fusion protein (multidrug efflux system)
MQLEWILSRYTDKQVLWRDIMVQEENNTGRKKKFAISILVIGTVIFLTGLLFYIRYSRTHISTDDAFIDGTVYSVSARINGTVKEVLVKDNQYVKEGDVLVRLEQDIYRENVTAASSDLEASRARLRSIKSAYRTAQKTLIQAQKAVDVARANKEMNSARFEKAKIDFKRAESLFQKGVITKDRYEKTETAYKVAAASVMAARKAVEQALAAVDTQKAALAQIDADMRAQESNIKKAETALTVAKLNLSYTEIYAPDSGYVTKKSVEAGTQIRAGQPLMAIVPLEDIYVVANYKETKLDRIKPGQRVKIEVDAYPEKTFSGHVESIMAGTGAAFSLFPPENATGNYVKVVQRVPVKIVFDKDADLDHLLKLGMSVVPTIYVE